MAKTATASSPEPPECGFALDGKVCRERGHHFCKLRADHVQAFFSEVLVHTKSVYARTPFVLADWQADEIIRPLFGWVEYDDEFDRYVRVYRICWIELARKNGKSELLAGIALYLLFGDGEESAEIYGCAKDAKQARKVWDVALRMVQLSPVLGPMLKRREIQVNIQEKKIIWVERNSYYEVITRDALGELGHNPHGIIFDEVLAQPDDALWKAMRSAMGTRPQPLMAAATTAGDDPSSFAAKEHKEMEQVAADPSIAPHILTFIRNTARDADPFDEANWHFSNPALGDFKSIRGMRTEAKEAKQDPTKENAFRQFQLNQWVQQTTRYMPLHLWDARAGEETTPEALDEELAGRKCYAGFDLAAKFDLTAWCLLFPDVDTRLLTARWRFWAPESVVPFLDKHTAGLFSVWEDQGWVTITEGDVLDYDVVYEDIEADAGRFAIADASCDPWCGEPVIQECRKRTGIDFNLVNQTFEGLSLATHELMALVLGDRLRHRANPVARWNIDCTEVKKNRDNPDLIKPVKPERQADGRRIDATLALIMSIDGWLRGDSTADQWLAWARQEVERRQAEEEDSA